MKTLIDIVVGAIPKISTNLPKYRQFEILQIVAGKLGMLEAQEDIGTSAKIIRNVTMQCRGYEATLFRLKQIDALLSSNTIAVAEQVALKEEKDAIMSEIYMPSGIPISVFAGESAEQSQQVADLMRDLQSGKVCLS